jgi:putative transposase
MPTITLQETGPVYQGRFKSFPLRTDEHFLTVARYVERNALRAKLATRAEDWQWSSIWRRDQRDVTGWHE